MEKDKLIELTQEKYPFLTGITYGGNEYVGIVVNHDNTILTFYDLNKMPSPKIKSEFLEVGELWWWESNRKIPINLFMKREMAGFKHMIKSFNTKDVEILFGPVVRLHDIAQKRVKRKSIQLVRKLK